MKLLKVPDPLVYENFRTIEDTVNNEPLIKGAFKFFSLVFTAAATAAKIPHKLGFQPRDVIMTSVSGGATVVWAYDSFTTTDVVITVSGACTVRCFIGAYAEGLT